MGSQYLSRTAVEAYLLIDADVNLREVVAIEIGTQHFAIFYDVLLLQLSLQRGSGTGLLWAGDADHSPAPPRAGPQPREQEQKTGRESKQFLKSGLRHDHQKGGKPDWVMDSLADHPQGVYTREKNVDGMLP